MNLTNWEILLITQTTSQLFVRIIIFGLQRIYIDKSLKINLSIILGVLLNYLYEI